MIAILHADKNWGIGKRNGLMFSLPHDMKFFREKTTGKVIVVGYNTLLSFPGGKPLKNRINVVLCEKGIEIEGCVCVHGLSELFEEIKKYDEGDVFVAGGASVYNTLLPYCSKVFLTKVDTEGDADVFVSNIDKMPDFEKIYESGIIPDNGYDTRYITYKNNNVKIY